MHALVVCEVLLLTQKAKVEHYVVACVWDSYEGSLAGT